VLLVVRPHTNTATKPTTNCAAGTTRPRTTTIFVNGNKDVFHGLNFETMDGSSTVLGRAFKFGHNFFFQRIVSFDFFMFFRRGPGTVFHGFAAR